MEKVYYVYSLCYPDGRPFYIGKGKNYRAKFHINCKTCLREKNLKAKIVNKLLKEGLEPLVNYLEVNLTEQEALLKEKEYIKQYGRIDNNTGCLANHTDGGEGVSGYRFNPEVARLRMLSRKGVPRSEEVKRKIKENRKYTKHSPETILKIRAAVKGKKRTMTEKFLKAIEKRRGVPRPPEVGLKVSLAQKGRKVPQERKDKISNTLKKEYKLIAPAGDLIVIKGLISWCKQNNLNTQTISQLSRAGYYTSKSNNKVYYYTEYKGYKSTIKPQMPQLYT
jgi:hypothetical protein